MNKTPEIIPQSWLVRNYRAARKYIASDRLRRVRSLLFQVYVLIALLAFAGLALLANTTPVFAPDVVITRDLQSHLPNWFGLILEAVSIPGYGWESTVLVVLAVGLLYFFGLHWESISALVAGVGSGALNYIIKVAVARPRPTSSVVHVFAQLNSFSFPSGHVMFYTAFFGFLLFLVFTLIKPTWWRWLLIAVLVLLIGLVGISRMYLGEHWGTDVIAGYLAGSLWLVVSIAFYRWGKARRVVQQPIAVTGQDDGHTTPAEHKELHEDLKSPLMPKKAAEKEMQQADEAKHDQPEPHDHTDRP